MTENRSLFVFGDSLSDTGNVLNFTTNPENQIPAPVPGGATYDNGRFSNGSLAVEILAEQLDLTFDLDNNFAWGWATTGESNIVPFLLDSELPGLLGQIDTFAEAVGAEGADPEALYVVWGGGKDFVGSSAGPEETIRNAVTNNATGITELANLGAETILVPLALNVGRTPLALNAGLFEGLTGISILFNEQLSDRLASLEAELEVDIVSADLFTITEELFANPEAFGFSNVTGPYLNNATPTGIDYTVSDPIDPEANVEEFFFLDLLHPTTRSHGILAEVLQEAIVEAPPFARSDTAAAIAGRLVTINPLENDSDPNADPLELVDFDRTTNNGSTIRVNDDGELIYRSSRRFAGTDTFSYSIRDADGNIDSSTVSIEVSPRDNLRGTPEADTLTGTATSDRLSGIGGDDLLLGGPGRDLLNGGMDNDTLNGGGGRDFLIGGTDSDTFVLETNTAVVDVANADLILAFQVAIDAIALTEGLTENDLTLELAPGGNTIIRISEDDRILGVVTAVTPEQLSGSFVEIDLPLV